MGEVQRGGAVCGAQQSAVVRVAALAALLLLSLLIDAGTAAAQSTPSPGGIVSRIKRVPVKSSALATVGYSKRLHALELEFVNGATYRYLDVPPSVHREMMAAESKTRFYHKHVRGHYRSVYVKPRRKR